MYRIVCRKELAPRIKLFEIAAPVVAVKAQPGQFVIVRLDETGERIPLTIADFNRETGTITVICQEVGYTTRQLGTMQEGDCLLDFAGPLGVPSEVEKYGRVICIGGGVGVAPVFPIARALQEAGNDVTAIIGARSGELLIWEEEMARVSGRLLVCTDDGSAGEKGFVTDLLAREIEGQKPDLVVAIGPLVMMKAVSELTRPPGIKTLVSLNPIMVDGTGMCGACRVGVGGQKKFACVDGPEFDGHQVDWDEAMNRSRMFREEEQKALTQALPIKAHNCGCSEKPSNEGGCCSCR